MAILKYDPVTTLKRLFDMVFGLNTLSFTERDRTQVSLLGDSDRLKSLHGIRSSRKYENQRSNTRRILVNGSKIEWRRLNEELSKLCDYISDHSRYEFIRLDNADND